MLLLSVKLSHASVDLIKCQSMKEAWDLLDRRYGDKAHVKMELLMEYKKSKPSAKTEEGRHLEVEREVTRLVRDLEGPW